ncbi:MAG: hypothetical protein AAF251_02580 [Pseudomonadota bacterium]
MDQSFHAHLIEVQRIVAHRGRLFLGLYLLLFTAPYLYLDLVTPESDGGYFLMNFVGIGLNFMLLYTLMRESDLLGGGPRTGIASFFGLSLIHSLGVLIGLVLVVLPGIYLMARWLPAFGRLLVSDEGVVRALGWSWDETSGQLSPLLLALSAPISVIGLSLAAIFLPITLVEIYPNWPWETIGLVALLTSNVGLSIGLAWYTVLGVSVYACLRDAPDEAVEAFE